MVRANVRDLEEETDTTGKKERKSIIAGRTMRKKFSYRRIIVLRKLNTLNAISKNKE